MKTTMRTRILFSVGISLLLFSCEKDFKKEENELRKAKITPEVVSDVDGNAYRTVRIGDQVWMVENLKTTKYNDGSAIPYKKAAGWAPGEYYNHYYWYNNNIDFKEPYGALYEWGVVASRKLAPVGWHVPDRADWEVLFNYLGENYHLKMMESGTAHWLAPNPGTNESGFSALPGGRIYYRTYDFNGLGEQSTFWSSSHWPSFPEYYILNKAWMTLDMAMAGDVFYVRALKDAVPAVETLPLSEISATKVRTGGKITGIGGLKISDCGVCWHTAPNPTIKNSRTMQPIPDWPYAELEPILGLGTFKSIIAGLQPNKTYYVRAYATNSLGTSYGEQLMFTTKDSIVEGKQELLIDIDGNAYKTVKIGTQIWMAENLKVTHYSNGEPIPKGFNSLSGVYFDYYYSSFHTATYGRLYNWYVVNDQRQIAPKGWHVPTSDDFLALENYLGGSNIAGGKLKETGLEHWQTPNTGATNESGFTGLPSGFQENGDLLFIKGTNGGFWSSTENDNNTALSKILRYNNSEFRSNALTNKTELLSIRCIKN